MLAFVLGLTAASGARGQLLDLPVGARLPQADHPLTALDGTSTTLKDVAGKTGTVLVFWSNECPWARKYRDRLEALAGTYTPRGIRFVLINANDPVAYPREAASESIGQAPGKKQGIVYLYDTGGILARALGAQRTPQVFVFNAEAILAYAGAPNDSPGAPEKARRDYLDDALAALLAGEAAPLKRTKAFGCRIKFAPNG